MKVLPASLNAVHETDSVTGKVRQTHLLRIHARRLAGFTADERGTSMPFTRRVLAGLTAIIAVVLGLSLATAGTAAASVGVWRAYGNTNPITSSSSTWTCTSTEKVAYFVAAQVCVVRSPSGGSVQGAVIVRNNRDGRFDMGASMSLWAPGSPNDYIDDWYCPESGVGPNSWSVCFGKTIAHSGKVYSVGVANGVGVGRTPNA